MRTPSSVNGTCQRPKPRTKDVAFIAPAVRVHVADDARDDVDCLVERVAIEGPHLIAGQDRAADAWGALRGPDHLDFAHIEDPVAQQRLVGWRCIAAAGALLRRRRRRTTLLRGNDGRRGCEEGAHHAQRTHQHECQPFTSSLTAEIPRCPSLEQRDRLFTSSWFIDQCESFSDSE